MTTDNSIIYLSFYLYKNSSYEEKNVSCDISSKIDQRIVYSSSSIQKLKTRIIVVIKNKEVFSTDITKHQYVVVSPKSFLGIIDGDIYTLG